MTPNEIASIETELSGLMQSRLGIKGASLEAQTARAGRKLPRKIRRAADAFNQTTALARHPKLALQIDAKTAEQNAKIVRKHLLKQADPNRRKKRLHLIADILLKVFAVIVLLGAVIYWRGLL
ncbi:hypothetical protein [Donghicola sp. XS_ASV15]|uniref:hypothetical protein n=1 Tax=Donghicola sp. XS_ASV15 TaxID=3241295 RepID=UPI003517BB29